MKITRTDKLILGNIIRDIDKVKILNIHELSEELFVSSSAISKACNKYGFTGYKDMQHRVKWEEDYKKKNILRLIIDVNEVFTENYFQETLSNTEWDRLVYTITYEICCLTYELPDSPLRSCFFNTLTNILFYLSSNKESVEVKVSKTRLLLIEFGI